VQPISIQANITLLTSVEMVHFCWRPRSAPLTEPSIDLLMVPMDAHFTPFTLHKQTNDETSTQASSSAPTNGRIYSLKFSSSSERYFFWLQSKTQHPGGDLGWWSKRDKALGEIVEQLLQGDEDVDVAGHIAQARDGGPDDDGDETMEDVEGQGDHSGANFGGSGDGYGGAGPGATGGDIREEGEESRDGGADGGRA
jgi:26S proteasome regulatory subunit N13